MSENKRHRGSGDISKLSEHFAVTEEVANRIRKLVQSRSGRLPSGFSGSVDGVASIAELIERMCAHGRRLPAEEAIGIAERVDHLINQLWTEIDELLDPSQAGTYW